MKQKRDRLQLIHDILKVIQAKKKMKPTHIMYKANLSHQMLDEYLGYLMENKFIVEEKEGRSKLYSLTDKGLGYVNQFKLITGFMESFGLEEN